MPLPYKTHLKFHSRRLRAEMTDCERLLWSKIRRKQIVGVQFYRQRPVGPFILDFYSNYPRMAIELDGGQHYTPEEMEKDLVRDQYLESLGIKVLRFDNLSVIQNCQSVLEVIADSIAELRSDAVIK